MLPIKEILTTRRLSQTALAQHLGMSDAALSLIVNHDKWPKLQARKKIIAAAVQWLEIQGVPDAGAHLFEVKPDCDNSPVSIPPSPHDKEEDLMLLDPQPLTQRAKDRFNLKRSPFEYELDGPSDVFLTTDLRERMADMESAALNKRFIAIYGESGSGKTTLRLYLQHQLEGKAHIIMPLTAIGMAENDRKGVALRIEDIYRAILGSIAPHEGLARSREDRAKQVRDAILRMGVPCCLVIEEAHRMPAITIQSLKGLRENNNHWQCALGVLLIGHQELNARLSLPSLREIGQRAARCEMQPLGKHLPDYIAHRFQRVNADVTKVFEPEAIDALAGRLTTKQVVRQNGIEREVSVSKTYPLLVGNTAVSIMNFAASLGAPRVTAEIVREWNHGRLS